MPLDRARAPPRRRSPGNIRRTVILDDGPVQVTDIWVYPVKSLAGQAATRARVEPWGLAGDRRWGLVDPGGHKMTALLDRRLLRLAATSDDASGAVTIRAGSRTRTVTPPTGRPVPIGGAPGASGIPAGGDVDDWISEGVGRPLRLFWQPDPASRPIPPPSAVRTGTA
ncbi:MOSC domain-containing protein [Marihabitans asiaticum]|uniref:MOSC domain-containing protein n=1 Tax=Marihabitans asiaticum TaxID=415218 RepID=A0A560WEB7_9MICO|nr:MOSC domain-containing protein [Marihabitans asiaticum]